MKPATISHISPCWKGSVSVTSALEILSRSPLVFPLRRFPHARTRRTDPEQQPAPLANRKMVVKGGGMAVKWQPGAWRGWAEPLPSAAALCPLPGGRSGTRRSGAERRGRAGGGGAAGAEPSSPLRFHRKSFYLRTENLLHGCKLAPFACGYSYG